MIHLFHGSRHDIVDGFDLGRRQSGFGNSGARGVGVYLTTAKTVAERYRAAGPGALLLDGVRLPELKGFADLSAHVRGDLERLLRATALQKDGLRRARASLKAAAGADKAESEEWQKARGLLRSVKSVDLDRGHIYAVGAEVGDEDLLDWDAPLSRQSPKVRQALEESGIAAEAAKARINDPTGFDIMMTLKQRNPDTYWGPDFGAHSSEALQAIGIPGCRHLDADEAKRGAQVMNYVIWDVARLKVLAKDGVPLAPSRRSPKLFHGTPNGRLDQLQPGRSGLIFTTEDPDYAACYGKTILCVEVDMRRPADLENDPAARALAIANFNESNFRNTDDGFSDKFDPENDETWELTESPTFKEVMERAGYDGAIFHETSSDGCVTARSHVVFRPEQVRVLPEPMKAREDNLSIDRLPSPDEVEAHPSPSKSPAPDLD